MLSKIKTLTAWRKLFDGFKSVWRAYRILRSGRTGIPESADRALGLRVRSVPFALYCRARSSDLTTLLEVFQCGEYQIVTSHLVPPIETIVDLGMNVGFATAYFFTLFPNARYLGIEPDAGNFAMAQRTLQPLIGQNRASLHHAFVGAFEGWGSLQAPDGGATNEYRMVRASAAAPSTIPVRTVMQLCEQENITSIDLLKCDIEGAEIELFGHCFPWIGRVRHLVIELHAPATLAWLMEALSRAGADFECLTHHHRQPDTALVFLRNRA